MSKRATVEDLRRWAAAGNVTIPELGITQPPRQHIPQKPVENIPKPDGGKENKTWMFDTLKAWCDERGYLLIRELTFSEDRDWRMDWAVFNGREKIVGVEYEGVFSKKSRHTTLSGYTEDSNKYREAALLGWKVLRYTAKNFKQLENDLKKL